MAFTKHKDIYAILAEARRVGASEEAAVSGVEGGRSQWLKLPFIHQDAGDTA